VIWSVIWSWVWSGISISIWILILFLLSHCRGAIRQVQAGRRRPQRGPGLLHFGSFREHF
jgi:hypothetical protein